MAIELAVYDFGVATTGQLITFVETVPGEIDAARRRGRTNVPVHLRLKQSELEASSSAIDEREMAGNFHVDARDHERD